MGLRHHCVSTFWKRNFLALFGAEPSKVIHDQIFSANLPHPEYDSDHSDKKHPTSGILLWSVSCGTWRNWHSRIIYWGNVCFSSWEKHTCCKLLLDMWIKISDRSHRSNLTLLWNYWSLSINCSKGWFLDLRYTWRHAGTHNALKALLTDTRTFIRQTFAFL